MENAKVLVTGATGFLGNAVCHNIEKDDRYTLIPLAGRKQWDLTKQGYMAQALTQTQPDVVVHLAATVGGIGANKENPGLFMYNNLAMGMNVIEECRDYGKLKKFIMVGTVCAYPKMTPVPFREQDLWNGYPEETNAPYGIAKKSLMQLLIAYYEQYDFNAVNLIPVNMYGAHDNFDPKISHVIPALILKFAKAKQQNLPSVEIWGTGNASREFLHSHDCARAINLAIEKDTDPLPINIGTGQEITIKHLANLISEKMGYEGVVYFNEDYPDGQPRRCLNISRAREILNFEPEISLEYGIEETVKWFEENKEQFVDYFDHI
jgi:GDP-L-fucose synthase